MYRQFGSRAQRIAIVVGGLGILICTAVPALTQGAKKEKGPIARQGIAEPASERKWPPAQGDCANPDPTQLLPPTTQAEISDYCYEIHKEKDKCQLGCVEAFKDVSKAPKSQVVTGVCNLTTAEGAFFADNASFRNIKANLGTAVPGTPPATATSAGGTIPYAKFGPTANTQAQEHNRDGANTQLKRMQEEFQKNLSDWSTLSNVDCFDCNVVQRWAVLKGAANLLAYTYTAFPGKDGVKVGLGNPDELARTQDDDGAPMDEYVKRPIATRIAYNPKSKVLSNVSEQWLAALNPDYIDRMKKAICKLAVLTPENKGAVYDGAKYFSYARDVQILVNEAFTRKDTGAKIEPSIFDAADKSENSVQDEAAKRPIDKLREGIANNAKRCVASDWELRPFSLDFYYDGGTKVPSWCPSASVVGSKP